MKKSIRILAVALVAIMLCISLVSCGKKLNGTYEAVVASEGLGGILGDALNSGVEYTFKGIKVTIEVTVLGKVETFEGKYSIKDDKITFTFEDADAEEYSGTETFEELDNGNVKIGGLEYKKIEK